MSHRDITCRSLSSASSSRSPGLRFTFHDWHHSDTPLRWATPLLAIAILLAAWNRFNRSRR
jgi:hypothetical protein